MFNFRKITNNDNKENIVRPFLCDQVKKFGFCIGPCVERHTLCKLLDKKYHNIPSKCFISIQLIKIITASHFIGRIVKYSIANDPIKDEDWIKVDDSFKIIKDELHVYCLLPESKIIHTNYIIGEIVMIETRGELFRAIVLDIINGWISVKVKVTLIDLGYTIEINSNKVFELPSHLKEIPPVVVEVFISSIEPIRENGSIFDWPLTTTKLVRSLLEPIILTNSELICKVELTLGITFWVDWMLLKKCIKCSHFVCKLYQKSLILPRELIERNLAKSNVSIINNLITLSKDAQIWEEDSSIDKLKKECTIIKKSNISLFSCEKQEIKNENAIIENQWAHLSKNTIYNVSVDSIEHPKCIIIRNLEFLGLLNDIQKDIDEAINNKTVTQLTCATVGTVCLALSPMSPNENKYNRVIIQQINGETANIFYVDYGELFMIKIKNLLSIPPNLITKLPFQAIECKLSGFKDMLQTDSTVQFNNRFLQLTDTEIYLKVISFSMDTEITGGNLYEVVLFNNDININVTMANEFNIIVEIDNTQIQNILNSNLKYNKYKNKDLEEYDEEDINSQFALLESLLKPCDLMNEKKKILHSQSQDLSQNRIVKKSIETNTTNLDQGIIFNKKQNIKHEKYVKMNNQYCLDCNVIPVIPQCFWHQDDKWIHFKLNIFSINNYNVHHTMDTITINIVTDSVSYYLILVLYAFITEELFTYHINFDGIRIKAQKLIQVKYKWPRLVKCPKKHKYIIYDTEYLTEHKDWNLWFKFMNSYKMSALKLPLNVQNYSSSASDDSDIDENQYTIFED